MNIINYNYEGSEISFEKGKDVMINATQMAKPFGKRTSNWLSLKQTNELINSLSVKTGIKATVLTTVDELVKSIVRKSHISDNQLVMEN